MTLRTKVASVILFVLVIVVEQFGGFSIPPFLVARAVLLLIHSLGMFLIIGTNLNVWLKLFLSGAFINTVFSNDPTRTTICVTGIIFILYLYYFLTKLRREEIIDLVKVVVVLACVHSFWVILQAIHLYNRTGAIYRAIELGGLVMFVNLSAIFLASMLPLFVLYKRKMTPLALAGWWLCKGATSIGSFAVAIGVMFYKKSKGFLVIALILLTIMGVVGAKKMIRIDDKGIILTDSRAGLYSFLIEYAKLRPVFGKGLGSFKTSGIGLVQTADSQPIMAVRPHNTFLGVLVEGGLVLLIPLVGFIMQTIVRFFKSEKTLEQRAVFAALSGIYFGCMFDFPERSIPMVLMIIVLIAAHMKLTEGGSNADKICRT